MWDRAHRQTAVWSTKGQCALQIKLMFQLQLLCQHLLPQHKIWQCQRTLAASTEFTHSVKISILWLLNHFAHLSQFHSISCFEDCKQPNQKPSPTLKQVSISYVWAAVDRPRSTLQLWLQQGGASTLWSWYTLQNGEIWWYVLPLGPWFLFCIPMAFCTQYAHMPGVMAISKSDFPLN